MQKLNKHVFIGYKFVNSNYVPIIVPKNFPLAIHNPNNQFVDYSNGLSSAMTTYFGSYRGTSDAVLFKSQYNLAKQFTVYLPHLHDLNQVGKINIYDLMNKGMVFVDEDDSIINIMFENISSWINNKKNNDLQKMKETSQNHNSINAVTSIHHFGYIFNPLMEAIYFKPILDNYLERPLTLEQHREYKLIRDKYEFSIVGIWEIFRQYPLLKELIQDLERRYPLIIKPFVSVDEELFSDKNCSISTELSPTQRAKRVSELLKFQNTLVV